MAKIDLDKLGIGSSIPAPTRRPIDLDALGIGTSGKRFRAEQEACPTTGTRDPCDSATR